MDAEPEADAQALDRLALWALQRYAPIVAADPPDGLVIDTTGAAHLHGGEGAMVAGMVERLAASGIAARAALADSWGGAHAIARYLARPSIVIAPGETATAILDLPIAALRLPGEMVESLHVLGFERIGELAAKPRAPLTLRFGPELGRRLDQALGRIAEPIDPVRSPDLIEVRRGFAEPIGAPETIARYTGKLVVQLCEALEAKGLGARRLDLALSPGRQPHRGDQGRNGAAGARREASDAAALRQDRDRRSRFRHRDHDPCRHARRAAGAEADRSPR